MYTRYYQPEIFLHTFDGVDRANHIVATYFMDDVLPGESFVDHFSLIQSMSQKAMPASTTLQRFSAACSP